MGLFRRGKADRDVADSAAAVDDDGTGVEPLEAISAARLGPDERARIEAGLATLSAAGIDVDDLGSLSTAFDAAVDRADASMLPVLAVGVGEHLDRHALLRWAVITDAFGRDLGLEGQRRDLHVIPDSLVSARWMRREKGWLEGAVRHLIDTAGR